MPRPHSEPATWPGKSSTPCVERAAGARAARRRARSAPSSPATARSGRAASPTNSASPESARARARRRACGRRRPRSSARAGGPGVWKIVERDVADVDAVAVAQRPRARRRRSPTSWIAIQQPCRAARMPWPETWSAWVCVSITPTRLRVVALAQRRAPRARRAAGRRRPPRRATWQPTTIAGAAEVAPARSARRSLRAPVRGRSRGAGSRSCPRRSRGSWRRGRSARSRYSSM